LEKQQLFRDTMDIEELEEKEIQQLVMEMECHQLLILFTTVHFLHEFMLDEIEFREKNEVKIESTSQLNRMKEILKENR